MKFFFLFLFVLLCHALPGYGQVRRKTITRAQLDHILANTLDAQGLGDMVKHGSGFYPGTSDRIVPQGAFEDAVRPCSIAAIWREALRSGRSWLRYQKMLSLIGRLQPAMLVDAVSTWGTWEMEEHLMRSRHLVEDLKKINPDLVVMGTPYEWVNEGIVQGRNIPQRVWDAFELPNEHRPFDVYRMREGMTEQMRGEGFRPEIKRLETQLYYYWLATTYIGLGCEAISFSAINWNGSPRDNNPEWSRVFRLIRGYADTCAAVRFALLTGHSASGFLDDRGRLLFDFHIEPMRPSEDPANPVYPVGPNGGACTIEPVRSCPTIYGNGLGGINPNGWYCARNPGLVFFDNYLEGNQDNPASDFHFFGQPHKVRRRQKWQCWSPYHFDEISWFTLQTKAYRDSFLRYADRRVRTLDTNLYMALPIKRFVAAGLDKYTEYTCDKGEHYHPKDWWPADYYAIDPDDAEGLFVTPKTVGNYFFAPPDRTRLPLYGGYGQEAVIKEILQRRQR